MSSTRYLLPLLSACLLLTACAAPSIDDSGSADSTTYDGLVKVKHAKADQAWVRPGFDISGYSKVMMVTAEIQYAPTSPHAGSRLTAMRNSTDTFPISEEGKQRIAAIFTEEFIRQLQQSEHFELTNSAGPDTLIVVGKLTDVKSYVPPDMVGQNDVYLNEVGEATLELELLDSQSNSVLARSIDRTSAEDIGTGPGSFTHVDSVNTWAEVRQLANNWASRLRKTLDDMAER